MEMNNFSHEQIELNKLKKNESSLVLSPLARTKEDLEKTEPIRK